MLTYPDRHRFEQIRARWESILAGEDETAEMVGRRVKQVVQQPITGDSAGSSKFRRKLSHGLAFISLQRKIIPGAAQGDVPSPAVTEPGAVNSATATTTSAPDSFDSCSPFTSPPAGSNALPSTTQDGSTTTSSADTTPRPLPRSRTISFIPRPTRSESVSLSHHRETVATPCSSVIMSGMEDCAARSKIPTPTPPLTERRRVSPRRHLSQHASQDITLVAATRTITSTNNGFPQPVAVRSRTMPNLVKSVNSTHKVSETVLKDLAASSPVLESTLVENVPIKKQTTQSQRQSVARDKPLKKESLAVPGIVHNRRASGSLASLVQHQRSAYPTPPTARKRMSSQLLQQTPVTVKRIQRNDHPKWYTEDLSHGADNSLVERSCATQPADPPASISSPGTVDSALSALPQLNGDTDSQRKTLGTPNGLGGMWRASCALAATNHEVRKLPRAHTFHQVGSKWDVAPPIPPVPEQYRTPSLPHLTQYSYVGSHTSPRPFAVESAGDLPLNQSTRRESDADIYDDSIFTSFVSWNNIAVVRPAAPILGLSTSQLPKSSGDFVSCTSINLKNRPWSINDHCIPEKTDINPFLQVKDYMPPLYWAGRFQSRFDQWRTEAMMAQLNPETHQAIGPLKECKLDQEKLAACYIFDQLRDLCASDQAADSLWEFEYQYRKDHRLLGNAFDLSIPLFRKQDDISTHKGAGAFGRAVRKLTPRKTSLVNLIKGKGWNKGEDNRVNGTSEHNLETSSISS